jgi:hypothetical protein
MDEVREYIVVSEASNWSELVRHVFLPFKDEEELCEHLIRISYKAQLGVDSVSTGVDEVRRASSMFQRCSPLGQGGRNNGHSLNSRFNLCPSGVVRGCQCH